MHARRHAHRCFQAAQRISCENDVAVAREISREKRKPDPLPVSYTHLDVYKRQGMGVAGGGRDCELGRHGAACLKLGAVDMRLSLIHI